MSDLPIDALIEQLEEMAKRTFVDISMTENQREFTNAATALRTLRDELDGWIDRRSKSVAALTVERDSALEYVAQEKKVSSRLHGEANESLTEAINLTAELHRYKAALDRIACNPAESPDAWWAKGIAQEALEPTKEER